MREVSASGIAGVHLVVLDAHEDPRGSLSEIFHPILSDRDRANPPLSRAPSDGLDSA